MAKKKKQKKKNTPSKQPVVSRPKEFLDLIAPAAVKFNTDHFILGGTYRSVVALRSYPPTTEELALLRRLGEMAGVTLRLSARRVTTAEEDAIIHAATNKNRMERSNFSNIKQSVTAEEKIQDVETLIKTTRRQTEPLIHCSCFWSSPLRPWKSSAPCAMRSTQFSSAPNWEQILYSYVRETDFFPPILLVKMRLAPLLNVCCLHPVWPICTQSAIRERRIRWAFMWAGTNMVPMLSWIWTDEPTTKPMPAP